MEWCSFFFYLNQFADFPELFIIKPRAIISNQHIQISKLGHGFLEKKHWLLFLSTYLAKLPYEMVHS